MNLLPKTEKENLKKGFKYRFIIFTAFLLAASFFVGSFVLLPSYFLATRHLSEDFAKNLETEDKDLVSDFLALPEEINTKLNFYQSNLKDFSASTYILKIVDILPEKVLVNSIYFSKSQNYKGKIGTVILISGLANDRESLVLFSKLLEESKMFSTVEVPVSNLTKEKNLPFSVNIFIEE